MKTGRQLKVANNLIDILLRDILYFLLIIYGKQVDTCVSCLNQHIKCNNPKTSTFSSSFAFDTKTNLPLTSTKRISNFRILHQFMLQIINVIGQRTITFCQSFCLAQEFFGIVECYYRVLCFCLQFLNQCVERCEILACKTPFLGFLKATGNSTCDESFFGFNLRLMSNQLINGHSLDCCKYLFQTGDEACILDVQYHLCHIQNVLQFECKGK